MPINEIREFIAVEGPLLLDQGDPTVIHKKINLDSKMRHQILSVDFMDDGFLMGGATQLQYGYSFYISTYPIVPSSMFMGQTNVNTGPPAGDDSVLFKAIGFSSAEVGLPDNGQHITTQQFPSVTGDSWPTFDFYTPHLYISLIIDSNAVVGTIPQGYTMSVYLKIKSTTANEVSFGMGVIGEYNSAQYKQLMNQGQMFELSGPTYAGRTFPAWKFGGTRSEFMARPRDVVAAWSGYVENADQMETLSSLQILASRTNEMMAFDSAFGTEDYLGRTPATNPYLDVPDWLRFDLNPTILTGDVRAQYPPVLKDTNGNTLMN